MKNRLFKNLSILTGALIISLLFSILLEPSPSLASSYNEPARFQNIDQPGKHFIRLQYAIYDPLTAEPFLPADLQITSYPGGSGPYIVQFVGPIQDQWKDKLTAIGIEVEGYIPDDAFLVRIDNKIQSQEVANIKRFDFVRWVGVFQPGYKLLPDLVPSPNQLYRVLLASWADALVFKDTLSGMGIEASGNGHSLVVMAQYDQIPQIAQLPDVLWIETYYFFEKSNDIADGIMSAQTAWNAGYSGDGQIVTIADTGLDTGVDMTAIGDIHLDFDNRVAEIRSWPVVSIPFCITNPGANDGPADIASGHGTHVSGSIAGNGTRSGGLYKGPAYEATLTFQAIEQETQWTGPCSGSPPYAITGIPDDLNDLFQQAYGWGSRIHTNSWGAPVNGKYDTSAQQVDQFAWNNKDFTILFAAGNSGIDANWDGYVDEDSLGSPATAKNAITIGASENNRSSGGFNPGGVCSTYWGCWPLDYPVDPTRTDRLSDTPNEMAAFSSRGPTDDLRIKPDLVAPGTNILSTRSSMMKIGTGWGAGPSGYMYNGGTSMATPLAAGAATVVRDYLVDGEGIYTPSSALIKGILINSAVDIPGYGNSSREAGQPIPNNHEGWGLIDLAKAIDGTGRTLVDSLFLQTGLSHTFNFTVTNSAVPLKATLVWTDYPGNPTTGKQLVNDLNLKLTAPNGTSIYHGNNFSGGWSVAGGSADNVNNVENVYIQSPVLGKWTIEVNGFNVPQGPQRFALIFVGAGDSSGPPKFFNTQFLPIISVNQTAPPPTLPTPGFWASLTGDEFYVTPDSAFVDDFAVHINVPNCGGFIVTHTIPEPISNDQFSFTGSFYAQGIFNSTTNATGTDGLSNLYIPACGVYVNGGPWTWSANWQNNSQPNFLPVEIVVAEGATTRLNPRRSSNLTITPVD